MANFGHFGCEMSANLGRFRPIWGDVGHFEGICCQIWPTLGRDVPISDAFDPFYRGFGLLRPFGPICLDLPSAMCWTQIFTRQNLRRWALRTVNKLFAAAPRRENANPILREIPHSPPPQNSGCLQISPPQRGAVHWPSPWGVAGSAATRAEEAYAVVGRGAPGQPEAEGVGQGERPRQRRPRRAPGARRRGCADIACPAGCASHFDALDTVVARGGGRLL